MNRELRLAVGLCVAGAALVLLAVGRTWLSYRTGGLTIEDVQRDLSGAQISGVTQALGLVGLAGVVALAATRSWGRILVGAVVALAGVGVLVSVLGVLTTSPAELVPVDCGGLEGCFTALTGVTSDGPADLTRSVGWPLAAGLGGLLLAGAGLLVAVRGRRWAGLSSAYEPPSGQPTAVPVEGPVSDKAVWDALDAGDDPTA